MNHAHCVLGASIFCLAPSAIAQPVFHEIRDVNAAWDVTNQGLVLLDDFWRTYSNSGLWTLQDGVILDGIPRHTFAFSDDGFHIVGESSNQPFYWNQDGDFTFIPFGNSGNGAATGITADGETVVGYLERTNEPEKAWRWSVFGGIEYLGSLVVDGDSQAADITADGSTITGWSTSTDPVGTEAFIWTEADGMRGIGNLGDAGSRPRGISDDGSTVVGMAQYNSDRSAFRWTEQTGMQYLGDLNDSLIPRSLANDVSADGSVIVGRARRANGEFSAFIWTESEGMRDLNGFLIVRSHRAQTGGWQLRTALAISPDGRIIVGTGSYIVNGVPERIAWALVLSSCAADLDGDGDVDADDFFSYLDSFAADDLPVCDIDADGDCDADDFFDFLDDFARGCD